MKWSGFLLPDASSHSVEKVFRRFDLPFRKRSWSAAGGEWAGESSGGSLEFYDHRAYHLGDDPRGINWNVYARTDHYVIKRFRAENQPVLDLVLDGSASMFGERSKAIRALELFEFCRKSAQRCGASTRIFLLAGEKIVPWTQALTPWRVISREDHVVESISVNLSQIPWRRGSMRILISDLLFPESPESVIMPMMQSERVGLFWSPISMKERNPWIFGNIQLRDWESGEGIEGYLDEAVLLRYQKRFEQHEKNWAEAVKRRGMIFARMDDALSLEEIFQKILIPAGSVEWRI